MLTFENNELQGSAAIVEKYRSFGRLTHAVRSVDVQPSVQADSILIFVSGTVAIDGGNPLLFSEVFQLVASSPGQYYIHNDIMRLNYGQ
jgi:hypothetical protein